MSVRSWRKEFYPVPASKKMTDIEAIESAILKFTGARPENLAKHGLMLDYASLFPLGDPDAREHFEFDAGSCALCKIHYNHRSEVEDTCVKCPLYKVTKQECGMNSDVDADPYSHFTDHHNPEPMIKALTKALKNVLKEEKKRAKAAL